MPVPERRYAGTLVFRYHGCQWTSAGIAPGDELRTALGAVTSPPPSALLVDARSRPSLRQSRPVRTLAP
jgi:hypothetical protein